MSFHPFAVQCLTCGSQLRVTDPAIVGTIAACPKCNSMVQVERPGGQVAVGKPNIDSEAITEEAIALDSLDNETMPMESTDAHRFAGSESKEFDRDDPAVSTVPPDWQSQRTRRSRQIALVVAVSLSGLLSAVAVFGWFVRSWREQSAAASSPSASAEVTETEPTSQLAVAPAVATVDPGDTADRGESQEPQQVDAEAELPETANSSLAENSEIDSDPASADPNPTPPIPADLMPQSPIIAPSDAARAEAMPTESNVAEEADTSNGGMQELPPELRKYTKFLIEEGATDEPTLAAPPTMDEVEVDGAAEDEDDPLFVKKRKKLNLKADLALDLALDSKGYPLADLMLLISQVTGVPIQVDWVSFDLAGIDIDQRVATQRGWRSARTVLDETALSLGAEIREQPSLLVFTPSDMAFEDQAMGVIADLSDFGDSRDSATKVLIDFLRLDANANANEKEIPLGQSRQQQQLAGLAIESLRRMRGIEPKVADQRLRRWANSSESESIEWPLLVGGDAGPQSDSPITIAGLLRRMAQRNQANCVVNWYDANRRTAAPEHLVIPHASVDASTTLHGTLSPFALQIRSVDARHWWVGTAATYDRLPVVLWTPPLGNARDAFTRQITAIMADATRDSFRLTIDDQSDRALLLLPRFIVRQLPKIAPAIAAK